MFQETVVNLQPLGNRFPNKTVAPKATSNLFKLPDSSSHLFSVPIVYKTGHSNYGGLSVVAGQGELSQEFKNFPTHGVRNVPNEPNHNFETERRLNYTYDPLNVEKMKQKMCKKSTLRPSMPKIQESFTEANQKGFKSTKIGVHGEEPYTFYTDKKLEVEKKPLKIRALTPDDILKPANTAKYGTQKVMEYNQNSEVVGSFDGGQIAQKKGNTETVNVKSRKPYQRGYNMGGFDSGKKDNRLI